MTKKTLEKLFSIWYAIIIVIIILLGVKQFTPIATKILTGLGITGIVLGICLLDLRRLIKWEVLEGLERRIGEESFQIAKKHLDYKDHFNISLDDKCQKSIRRKVLQYFKDAEFKCKIVTKK